MGDSISSLSVSHSDQLLGQQKAKNLIQRSLSSGRIPHAYLFKGIDGIGKKLFATGLAVTINCQSTTDFGGCAKCSSCKKYLSGNHPDFFVLGSDKKGIKIEQVRKLRRDLEYPPYESQKRVIVLEDVHTMRQEAANSLLKTLEEPPEGNLFILTVDSSIHLLETITSRCQVVPFLPLSVEDTETVVLKHGVEPHVAKLLARLSEGSPGKAIILNDYDMIDLWQEVQTILSTPDIDPNRDVLKIMSLAKAMSDLKDALPSFLALLKLGFRDLLLEDRPRFYNNSEAYSSKSWSSEELFAKLHAIDKAEREIAANCNKSLVCEVLLFRLI